MRDLLRDVQVLERGVQEAGSRRHCERLRWGRLSEVRWGDGLLISNGVGICSGSVVLVESFRETQTLARCVCQRVMSDAE